jgi:hypothetical protein
MAKKKEATATVEKRATHWHSHVDEVAVRFLLEVVDQVKIELRSLLNASSHEGDIEELIGAGGSSLDEHINGGSGRKKHSAFALAIEKLGLTENRKAVKLAEFINRVDSGSGTEPFEISSILQNIHRAHPGSSQEGIDWCMDILRAYWHDADYFKRGAQDVGKDFERMGVAWLLWKFDGKSKDEVYAALEGALTENFAETLKRLGKNQDPALLYMAKFFENGASRMLQPFGLPRAIASVKTEKGFRTAVKKAFDALDAKLETQKDFHNAKDELAGGEIFQAGRYKAFRIVTGNKSIKDAILNSMKDVSIIIQKNSYSGHVQIFSRSSSGIRFEELAAAIRLEELKLAEKTTDELFDEELKAAGNSCGVDNWHFIVRRIENGVASGSYMLLNGSNSYPGIKATAIRWDRLKELVIRTFS